MSNVSWIKKLNLNSFCTSTETPSRDPSQRRQAHNVYTEKYVYRNISIEEVMTHKAALKYSKKTNNFSYFEVNLISMITPEKDQSLKDGEKKRS